MRGSGYVNAYATPKKKRARRDVCGHARREAEHTADGSRMRCKDCGHTWLEVTL